MFEKILGNEQIKKELENSAKQNRTSHSYLFTGIEGIGKKLISIEFAKALLCLENNKNNDNPNSCDDCNNCKSCLEFDSENHPDFKIIEPEGSSIKIEQIREMQKKIQEKPIISEKKIYIIDNADLMTKEAQNCLLKTLEEPPQFATIILIGSNENAFLATIKSRCMILHFKPIENEEIRKYLEENFQIENISQTMLETFQGSIGKAIQLKDRQEEYINLEKMIYNLNKSDLITTIKSAETLYKSKEEIFQILDYLNIILLKIAKTDYLYTNCIKTVENTKQRLQKNANYDMCIDNLIFNLWEEVN